MPRPPLTKRIFDDAIRRAKRHLIFDGLVHGFALKVEVSGARVWVVQKSQAGRSIRVTLGTYPDLTVDQARRAAQLSWRILCEAPIRPRTSVRQSSLGGR